MSDEGGYTTIRFGVDGSVALVTLHRPDVLNAWTDTMGLELADAMRRCVDFAGLGAGRACG
jgi:enoyl-CoA hydratase/carnithine racemase